MKFAVIGATGYVGRAVVRELASRGHEVAAFARHVEKVEKAPNVRAVAADVNAPDFAGKLEGFDAVVSAFNPGWSVKDIGPSYTRGGGSIVAAARMAGVPYLLIVGGAGCLLVDGKGTRLNETEGFPEDILAGSKAVTRLLLSLLNDNSLNWAFICPPALLGATGNYSEERKGKYREGGHELMRDAQGAPAGISVADLAIAIADAAERKSHLRDYWTVAD
ncbi:MAG: NAD(P)H-binding protein [Aeromonadales bacterium]|nr:NAD(P)H-binding protein [Aeromonadales bacterium]MDY2890054.1 NAD(P)H-binding protein [Succinivibrio sp.]